jgi:hypothetical protein
MPRIPGTFFTSCLPFKKPVNLDNELGQKPTTLCDLQEEAGPSSLKKSFLSI